MFLIMKEDLKIMLMISLTAKFHFYSMAIAFLKVELVNSYNIHYLSQLSSFYFKIYYFFIIFNSNKYYKFTFFIFSSLPIFWIFLFFEISESFFFLFILWFFEIIWAWIVSLFCWICVGIQRLNLSCRYFFKIFKAIIILFSIHLIIKFVLGFIFMIWIYFNLFKFFKLFINFILFIGLFRW